MSVTRDSGSVPFLTALTRLAPQKGSELGMPMSSPLGASLNACCAPQSDTTKPCGQLACAMSTLRQKSYLKAELGLEDPVERLAVPTRIRLVEAVVRAHDVGRTSLDQINKRPAKVSFFLQQTKLLRVHTRDRARASSCHQYSRRRLGHFRPASGRAPAHYQCNAVPSSESHSTKLGDDNIP